MFIENIFTITGSIIFLMLLIVFWKRIKYAYNSSIHEFNFTFTGLILVLSYQSLLYANESWIEDTEYTLFHFLATMLRLQVFLVVPMFLLLLKDDTKSYLIRNRKVHYVVISIFGGMLAHHYDDILLTTNLINDRIQRSEKCSTHLLSLGIWCGIILSIHIIVYVDLILRRRFTDVKSTR